MNKDCCICKKGRRLQVNSSFFNHGSTNVISNYIAKVHKQMGHKCASREHNFTCQLESRGQSRLFNAHAQSCCFTRGSSHNLICCHRQRTEREKKYSRIYFCLERILLFGVAEMLTILVLSAAGLIE